MDRSDGCGSSWYRAGAQADHNPGTESVNDTNGDYRNYVAGDQENDLKYLFPLSPGQIEHGRHHFRDTMGY